MKRKLISSLLIAVLCTCLFVGCGVNAAPPDATSSIPSSSASVPSNSTVSPDGVAISDNTTPSKYDKVMALQTEGYQALSLKEFNTTVKAAIDKDAEFLSMYSELLGSLTTKDSAYQFAYETLQLSIDEVIMPQMEKPIAVFKSVNRNENAYAGDNEETFYNFMFMVLYSVEYRVVDDNSLTVRERDELISAYHTGMEKAVNGMSREQLTKGGIKAELQKIADSLCSELSTKTVIFENAKISSIEIIDGDKEQQQ